MVAQDFKPRLGGIAELASQMAGALGRLGWRVVVAAPEGPAEACDAGRGYEVLRIVPRPTGGLLGRLGFGFRARAFGRRLRRLVRDRQAGYVLVASPMGVAAMRATRGTGVRTGLICHGNVMYGLAGGGGARRRAFRRAARHVDDVFANSRFTAAVAQEALGRAKAPAVIGCGIAPETMPPAVPKQQARAALGLADGAVLLTVARLEPRKGVDMVLRALPAVREAVSGTEYVVAGDGPDRPRLEALAAELDVARHVRFIGRFGDDMLAVLYGAADVFVMPGRAIPPRSVEGYGIVYVEAAHYGLPAIGGRSGGIPEAIAHEQTGLLVDPEDADEIAAAAVRLLTDGALRGRLAAAARQRAEREQTWAAVAARLDQQIRRGLDGEGRS